MLGAQLDDLHALAGQLDRTGAAIADCQSRSTADTNQVVESVRGDDRPAADHDSDGHVARIGAGRELVVDLGPVDGW